MKQNRNKFLLLLNVLIILTFTGISFYIYIGFFHPDPGIFYLTPFTNTLLIAIKLFFPVFVLSVIVLYLLIYLKKVKLSSVILLMITLFIFSLILYPIGDYYYRNSLTTNIDEFHSYLQLDPPSISSFSEENINIFCLGGSTTEFEDEKGRDWPDLVQKELNRETSLENLRVFNLGKQWYTTQHILINYMINLKKYKPDAIIVMENINDLLHNADFSWLSNGELRDDYGNFLGPTTRLVKYKSFAGYIVTTIKGLWYKDNTVEVNTDEFPGLVSFERNLELLMNLAQQDTTLIILMTQPHIYKDSMSASELHSLTMLNVEAIGSGKKWTYKTALNGMRQYNDKIREVALKHSNVYLIDLDKIVPKTSEYFIDDVHYNSKSIDLISKYISSELKQILTNRLTIQ